MAVASRAGVMLIELYQRHISPRKGFRCAYGALHGNGSGTCSSIGKRIMREQGMIGFVQFMPQQFAACQAAAIALNAQISARTPSKHMPRKGPCDFEGLEDTELVDNPIGCACKAIRIVLAFSDIIAACS